jgi:CheY-like chemotaxis protein
MNPKHIAFVDDEVILHKLIKIKFKSEIEDGSLITYHFMDGLECLNYLRANKENLEILLLFSDITMPNMDGITLTEYVKVEFPKIELFIVSALDIDEYKKRVKNTTTKEFLGKPVNLNKLRDIIFKVA